MTEPRLFPMDAESRRLPKSRAYAILNDCDRPVADAVLDAMRNYDITPLPWFRRNEVCKKSAA